ncbi:MAG TPA: type II toxin-antitoxin system VapC family toxin [Longimicrobium sp.]|nr:type II toxin-antitoxin system VapC family toxin [Longimicrobium sp.]
MYIETTIPSFYFDRRRDAQSLARRAATRAWWEVAGDQYELTVGAEVLRELGRGEPAAAAERLALVAHLPVLPAEAEVVEIVQEYIRHKLMPAEPGGDALHLALASHHRCDYLVTWNCRHLANANKFGHISRVNAILGLQMPRLVTPLELLGGSDEEEPGTAGSRT